MKSNAYMEGKRAAEQGFTGPNPYIETASDLAVEWAKGFCVNTDRAALAKAGVK